MDEFFKLLIFSGMMNNITEKNFGSTKFNIEDENDEDEDFDDDILNLDYNERID